MPKVARQPYQDPVLDDEGHAVLSWRVFWDGKSTQDSGSFDAVLTGCTTAPTVKAQWTSSGNIVTMTIPAIEAISNTTACTITGMPEDARPKTAQKVFVSLVEDNSVYNAAGFLDIAPSGVITLGFINGANPAGTTTFTNVGNKGLGAGWTFSYLVSP